MRKRDQKMIPYSCKNRYKTGEQKIFPDKLEKDKSGYSHNRISGGMDRSIKDKDKESLARSLVLVEATVLTEASPTILLLSNSSRTFL